MNIAVQQDWQLREVAPIEPGIVCLNIEKMIAFYTEILGLRVVNDAETTAETSLRFGVTPDGYRIVRLQTAQGQKIKLVQPRKQPARSETRGWVFERQGLSYLTFVVADVQEVVAKLRSCGLQFASPEVIEIRKGIFAIFTRDPEDNYLEFVELRNG